MQYSYSQASVAVCIQRNDPRTPCHAIQQHPPQHCVAAWILVTVSTGASDRLVLSPDIALTIQITGLSPPHASTSSNLLLVGASKGIAVCLSFLCPRSLGGQTLSILRWTRRCVASAALSSHLQDFRLLMAARATCKYIYIYIYTLAPLLVHVSLPHPSPRAHFFPCATPTVHVGSQKD